MTITKSFSDNSNKSRTTKKKLKQKLDAALDTTQDFCLNIDGLKHCVDRSRHWFERIWWFFTVVLSFSICAYFILDLWVKRSKYPVTVIYDDKISSIGSIPFPAVTICPPARVASNKFNLTNFIEKYKEKWPNSFENVTSNEKNGISALLHICHTYLREWFAVKEMDVKQNDVIIEQIKNISVEKSSIFRGCAWLGRKVDCDMFQLFLTERGHCFTYNMLNTRSIYTNIIAPEMDTVTGNPDEGNWNIENELLQITSFEKQLLIPPTYPHHIVRLDDLDSLALTLNFVPSDFFWNYECELPTTKSFKVWLHRPGEIRQAFARPIEVEIGRKVIVYIEPKVITASPDVRKYNPYLRRCYFNSERKLKFFKVYTRSNCEHECLADFVKKECGCVKFVMPRVDETKICDVTELFCYSAAVNKYRQKRNLNDSTNAELRDECNCLPSCVDLTYETEVLELEYIDKKVHLSSNISTILTISFKDNEFLTLKRAETYTITSLVSTCGGLLGLFMGISLLSIAELIFQFIANLAHKIRREKLQTFPYTS